MGRNLWRGGGWGGLISDLAEKGVPTQFVENSARLRRLANASCSSCAGQRRDRRDGREIGEQKVELRAVAGLRVGDLAGEGKGGGRRGEGGGGRGGGMLEGEIKARASPVALSWCV